MYRSIHLLMVHREAYIPGIPTQECTRRHIYQVIPTQRGPREAKGRHITHPEGVPGRLKESILPTQRGPRKAKRGGLSHPEGSQGG